MAIPRFGSFSTEKLACLALFLVGVFGLVMSATGQAAAICARLPPHPTWLCTETGQAWLIVQSLLIMAGSIGAYESRSFTVALVGTVASLVFLTPVGVVSFVPGVWMLVLVVLRFRSFFPMRYGLGMGGDRRVKKNRTGDTPSN